MTDFLLKAFYWSAFALGVINLSMIGAALIYALYVTMTGNILFI